MRKPPRSPLEPFPKLKLLLVLLALPITAGGCCTSGSPRWVADLGDCASLSIGAGPGLAVDLKLGALTHPALGLGQVSYRVGHEYRSMTGLWQDAEIVAPAVWFAPGKSPGVDSCTRIWFARQDHQHWGDVDGWWGPSYPQAYTHSLPQAQFGEFHHWGQIEAGVTILLVSVRASINPPEIADFILGFWNYDIAHDDDWSPPAFTGPGPATPPPNSTSPDRPPAPP